MNKRLILIFIFLVGIIFVFISPIKFLINFTNDDSFFYIKTAYNFSKGYGSTFDLVNPTNGYHPLWFIILSTYFFILNFCIPYTPELYFRFTVLLEFILCTLIFFILNKSLNLNGIKDRMKYLGLFSSLFLLFVFRDFGLEPHLICFLISLYIYVKSVEINSNSNHLNYKCLLLILLFLSRIDFLFSVLPVIIFSDYLTSAREYRNKFIFLSVLSLVIISFAYFLFNYMVFGHFLPISGFIKNSFPDICFGRNLQVLLNPGYLTNQFVKLIFTLATILTFIVFLWNKNFRSRLKEIDLFVFGICCSSMVFMLIHLSFNTQSLREWYVAFPSFVSSILLVRALMAIFARLYYSALTLFIFIFAANFYLTRIENSKWDNVYDYAKELKNKTSNEDRIYQIDLCGIVGFFSERKIVNGDGLINSFEYQEYLVKNKLIQYLREKKINLYSTHSDEGNLIADNSGLYKDKYLTSKSADSSLVFSGDNLIFEMPFSYNHVINKSRGSWYLFKLKE